jgi:hypothetical protein
VNTVLGGNARGLAGAKLSMWKHSSMYRRHWAIAGPASWRPFTSPAATPATSALTAPAPAAMTDQLHSRTDSPHTHIATTRARHEVHAQRVASRRRAQAVETGLEENEKGVDCGRVACR